MADPFVMFSPLPPRKSGISSYTAELLPSLCAHRPVVLVCEEGYTPEIQRELGFASDALQVISTAEYAADKPLMRLPHVYQIGNNRDHVFVYDAFKKHPGILVQHDFNLHYLVEDATLVRGDTEGYKRVLREEYGDAGASLADLRQMGIFSDAQKINLPVNRHLLHSAKGVIVHNHWVYDRLPSEVRHKTLNVPHHYSPMVASVDGLNKDEARQELGLPEQGFMVLSLGFITPPKQIQATVAALARFKQAGLDFFFVVAGQRNPSFDIDAVIRQHDLEDRVIVTGYVDEAAFFKYIRAADLLVNLRYPTVGESSGTLARALALGLPAIVHNFGPFSEFPDDVVLKVPLELGEPTQLAKSIELMMDDPELRFRLGRRAEAYMRHHCSVEHSATAYLHFIDRFET
jgi:glycosyltransferase involved in cell wall biosynthesis